jgi:hypothetical protein
MFWIQTIDNKRNKHYYCIEYSYTGKADRYRVWTSNPQKDKISIWNKSKDLDDIERIFGDEKLVGTY